MADITIKSVEDFEPIFGGGMLRARSGLGVQSFGMQVEEFPPDATQYPEHDHSEDGMEEVYIVLEGTVILQVGGAEHILTPGTFARVGPAERRKLITREEGARVVAIGAVPGKVYEPPEFTEEGQPDPMKG
jgi:quercetin dioxygenase-like cupin family protein